MARLIFLIALSVCTIAGLTTCLPTRNASPSTPPEYGPVGADGPQPQQPDLRPWVNERQQVQVMLSIAQFAAGDQNFPPDCGDYVAGELEAVGVPKQDVGAPVSEGRTRHACEVAFESCGACHLPNAGNCSYTVHTLNDDGREEARRVVVSGVTDDAIGRAESIVFTGENTPPVLEPGQFFRNASIYTTHEWIPIDRITRIVWNSGGDRPGTWWNFERLHTRGEMARRMLAIATENNVACTNCHVAHGNFELTREGEIFHDTGRVIRRVPLQHLFD